MNNSKYTGIILKRSAFAECEATYLLFQQAMLIGNFMNHLQLHGEKPIDFTKRLSWLTKGFYAIKIANTPQVIGFSFIYQSDSSYFYGAAILPDHYNRHILNQAMEQTADLAKYCYGIDHINFKLTVLTMNMSQKLSTGVINMPNKKQKDYTGLVA